jgi:hypothetical protein
VLYYLSWHNTQCCNGKKVFSCENKENKRKRVISKQKAMRTEKETQFGIALPLLPEQYNQVEVISLIRSPFDESGKRKFLFTKGKAFFLVLFRLRVTCCEYKEIH